MAPANPSTTRTFTADRGDDRHRLDRVVLRHLADLPAVSRARVQIWLGEGRISLGCNTALRASQRVPAGASIRVVLPHDWLSSRATVAQPLSLAVVYEDEYLLVIDKPAGLIVHPSYKHRSDTLMNGLVERARGWPAECRPSLVNRLDKYTSGLVLVAKSRAAHAALTKAVAGPDARKEYLAVCYGRMRVAEQSLRYALGRDPGDRRRVAVRDDGATSLTVVTRVAASRGSLRGVTLVRCRLMTGRTHQIRVHLREAGLPIVGDAVYGAAAPSGMRDATLAPRLAGFPRQALHAWRIEFPHPLTGASLAVQADLPADMAALLDWVGIERPGETTAARPRVGSVA